MLEIKKAVRLQNHRVLEKNALLKEEGSPQTYIKITELKIGKKLWPFATDENARQKIYNLSSGKRKSIEIDQVELICHETGVDANFLFGYPSIHDQDFIRYKL